MHKKPEGNSFLPITYHSSPIPILSRSAHRQSFFSFALDSRLLIAPATLVSLHARRVVLNHRSLWSWSSLCSASHLNIQDAIWKCYLACCRKYACQGDLIDSSSKSCVLIRSPRNFLSDRANPSRGDTLHASVCQVSSGWFWLFAPQSIGVKYS